MSRARWLFTPRVELLWAPEGRAAFPSVAKPWHKDAACADAVIEGGSDPFAIEEGIGLERHISALLLCAQCPVREVCGREAAREGDAATIRGGMTPADRFKRWGGGPAPDQRTPRRIRLPSFAVLAEIRSALSYDEAVALGARHGWSRTSVEKMRIARPAKRRRDPPPRTPKRWAPVPSDPRCGTNAGYAAHSRRGEIACDPCTNAHRATRTERRNRDKERSKTR